MVQEILGQASLTHAPTTGPNSDLVRLVQRTGFGTTIYDIAQAKALGYQGYLEYQLDYNSINDAAVDNAVQRAYPRIFGTAAAIAKADNNWEIGQELIFATMYRAAYSRRRLYQKMVEFWTDHFNIYLDKVGPALKCPDDLNVIRKNALGSFPQMLSDSAHSAAMMQYLDNAQSYSGNPNQNYARELMELHTLGVNGGYTQQDVIEVARCLTGWGLQWDDTKPGYQEFLYSSDAHDDASKVVLGVSIPAGGGQADGERVIQILASHPSTARFLATKLIRYFYGIEPDTTYRDSVAAAYMSSSGDIKATLRAVFAYPISAAAPKLKRPFQLLTGTLYTLRTRYTTLDSLRWNFLGDLGHVPFDWAPPNGYPDKTGYWSGGMLQRWNFALAMSRGDIGNLPFNASIFLRPYVWGRPTAEKFAYAINTLVFNGLMDSGDLGDLIRFLKAGPLSQERINGALALAWCSPSYQYF